MVARGMTDFLGDSCHEESRARARAFHVKSSLIPPREPVTFAGLARGRRALLLSAPRRSDRQRTHSSGTRQTRDDALVCAAHSRGRASSLYARGVQRASFSNSTNFCSSYRRRRAVGCEEEEAAAVSRRRRRRRLSPEAPEIGREDAQQTSPYSSFFSGGSGKDSRDKILFTTHAVRHITNKATRRKSH